MTSEGCISPKLIKVIKDKKRYIVLDEFSMITKDLWKRLCLLKQETGIIFLRLGDAKQCPPAEHETEIITLITQQYLCNNILLIKI